MSWLSALIARSRAKSEAAGEAQLSVKVGKCLKSVFSSSDEHGEAGVARARTSTRAAVGR
jgi:hypothetical protein